MSQGFGQDKNSKYEEAKSSSPTTGFLFETLVQLTCIIHEAEGYGMPKNVRPLTSSCLETNRYP